MLVKCASEAGPLPHQFVLSGGGMRGSPPEDPLAGICQKDDLGRCFGVSASALRIRRGRRDYRCPERAGERQHRLVQQR